jgi:DNA repair protein RecN (Recombination protein N)
MLKALHLNHIILVDQAHIEFGNGLNILSGETGAGKSAILGALNLIIGNRGSNSIIRQGESKAVIEALFDLEDNDRTTALLEEAGIDSCDLLIVRREIYSSGKSRCFINNQMAQQALLKKLISPLIHLVGQHANQELLNVKHQRWILDQYGEHQESLKSFRAARSHENILRKELDNLKTNEARRLREIEVCKMEIEEITEASIKSTDEEEELFAEYTRLTHADTLIQELSRLTNALSGDSSSVLGTLNLHNQTLSNLQSIDPSFDETAKAYHSVYMELEEIAYTLERERMKVDNNPHRLDEANKRLGLLNSLKRKYGGSLSAVLDYLEKRCEKLEILEDADDSIDRIEAQVIELKEKTNQLAKKLSNERKKSAKLLEKELTKILHRLNMSGAQCDIQICEEKRSEDGDDYVEFYLAPNVGEKLIPVKDCASGGELSRLMLAVKATLAGKDEVPTLIFDEIDSNIGGETAVIVGKMLAEIGENHQVLCVTHFPQVAKQAQNHYKIAKHEDKGRTLTTVQSLNTDEREEEITRMLGGNTLAKTLGS